MNIQMIPGITMLCNCHCLKTAFICSVLCWNMFCAPFLFHRNENGHRKKSP